MDAVRLAVSEAVSNAVQHAYRGTPGPIRVSASVISGVLRITIADDGCGHETPARQPGLGLGVGLMAGAGDEFEFADDVPVGTEVHLGFLVEPGRAGPITRAR